MTNKSKRGTRRTYSWTDPTTGNTIARPIGGKNEDLLRELMSGPVAVPSGTALVSRVNVLRNLGVPILTTFAHDTRTGRRVGTYSLEVIIKEVA